MSCNNVFIPRSSFTSTLFKVLVTLKLLHGSRGGAKGSTLEDIAMHMIKHFCLDGDVKSQVLASLKFGVKMHFIHKRKDKFSLILPASSIHLAPCKFKADETERIQCIFPAAWYSNAGSDSCGGDGGSRCGKRKRTTKISCCDDSDEDEQGGGGQGQRGGTCSACAHCQQQQGHKPKKPKHCPTLPTKPVSRGCNHHGNGKAHKKFCAQDDDVVGASKYPYDAHVGCRCCNNKKKK